MDIRNGPGAAILPPTVTKLHLEFAHKFDHGHAGPRKFWKNHLPSLKYHNPTVPMIVNRTRDQRSTPILTIYMTGDHQSPSSSAGKAASEQSPAASTSEEPVKAPKKPVSGGTDPWQHIASSSEGTTPAPEARDGETAIKINLKEVLADDIWKQFVAKTGATPVEPSAADVEEMERLAALKAQSELDRKVQDAHMGKLKEEKRMLERARQEAAAIKAE